MAKQQKVKENELWRQNGYYMITVEFGAEKLGRYIVKADTFGEAIQKIVNDELKEYPEAFEYGSAITFKRETFEEIK